MTIGRFGTGVFVAAALSTAGAANAAPKGLVSMSGPFQPTTAKDGEARARELIAREAPWTAPLALGPAREVALASGIRMVRMPEMHLGVPVLQRGAVVTFAPDGSPLGVVLALEDDLPASVTPSISPAGAAAVATSFSGARATEADAKLAVWPSADGAKLAWIVYPAPVAGIPRAPLTIVDATSGEAILRYDALLRLDKSQVYPTNPVKSPALADVTLPLDAAATTLGNTLIVSKNCIDNHHTTMLMGFPVHVCDLLQTAVADANGDFLIPPGMDTDPEDAFSEVSMFYHANRAYTFFRGFDPALDVNGMPLPTVSNLRIPQGFQPLDLGKLGDPNLPLDPFQNAFFAPSNPLFSMVFGIQGGAMWFGQGPLKDYSYDGDVIYHEFTHSVVNVTLQLSGTPHMDAYGASYAPPAMNEGLADYFSSALAGDPDVGEYATQDIMPGSTAIRTLDNKDACPSAVGGEAHQDSTLFSGALWDARKALSPADQATYDAAIYAAMNSSMTGDLAYEDFAKLATDALMASPLGKPVADALTAAFTAHGVLPKCTRILEPTGVIKGPAGLNGFFFSPGTATTGVKTKEGYTAGVFQAHLKVPAGTGQLTVKFSGKDEGAQGLGMGGTPFKPNVLARFKADPIQFTYKPMAPQTDTVVADTKASGTTFTATVPAPAGATDVYVMIGNLGQNDGIITDIDVKAEMGMPTTTSSTGAGGSDATSSSAGTGASGPAANPPQEIGGCGCSIPANDAPYGELALVAAMIGLGATRRKRRG